MGDHTHINLIGGSYIWICIYICIYNFHKYGYAYEEINFWEDTYETLNPFIIHLGETGCGIVCQI